MRGFALFATFFDKRFDFGVPALRVLEDVAKIAYILEVSAGEKQFHSVSKIETLVIFCLRNLSAHGILALGNPEKLVPSVKSKGNLQRRAAGSKRCALRGSLETRIVLMKVGILQCDHVPTDLRGKHGDYDRFFYGPVERQSIELRYVRGC
jgi:hypothetical protein